LLTPVLIELSHFFPVDHRNKRSENIIKNTKNGYEQFGWQPTEEKS
jgi:hypothetical protein